MKVVYRHMDSRNGALKKKNVQQAPGVVSNTGATQFSGWKQHLFALVVSERGFILPEAASSLLKRFSSGRRMIPC